MEPDRPTTHPTPIDCERVFLDKAQPAVYRALTATSQAAREAVAAAGLDRITAELVNLRCSQINGCAFCLNLHTKDALAAGVTHQQLAVLPAWREAPGRFRDLDIAALELAELTTNLPHPAAADRAFTAAADVLTADQVAAIEWAAIVINAFNRVSILSRHPVREDHSY